MEKREWPEAIVMELLRGSDIVLDETRAGERSGLEVVVAELPREPRAF